MTSPDDDLRHDLSLALHTITETNQSIRFADTKAGALAAVQALMVTILAAHHDRAGETTHFLRAGCVCGVLVSALLLAAGQAPRLFDHRARPNRVAFPALVRIPAEELLQVPSMEQRHEDAWQQAATLARVAVTKYRWLARAAVGTAISLTAVLGWLICITWSSAG